MRFHHARLVFLAAGAAFSGSCMTGMSPSLPPPPAMISPGDQGEMPRPVAASNQTSAIGVVEVSLRAAPAQAFYLPTAPTPVWAYNDVIPGPTIEARAGDTVIVHFRNDLPEPTTIHWHGVRVPNDMDGAGRMLHPIPPGGTFDYRFVVPDAGLFWYHPHVNSAAQVAKGLYGAIVVRSGGEDTLAASSERLLVLDDVLIDPVSDQVVDATDMRSMMMGTEGNLVLVNGQASNRTIAVSRGERLRLRVVNTAIARYFNLVLVGGSMTQVGGDSGWLAAPRPVKTLLMTPGERADLIIDATNDMSLQTAGYERAHGAGGGADVEIARIVIGGATPGNKPSPLPSTLRPGNVLPAPVERHTVVFDEAMGHHHGWQFTINGQTYPNVTPVEALVGTQQLWEVHNDSSMDHPLHIHGFFFQPLGNSDWKDTINIPRGAVVNLVVDFADRPGAAGDWMYHCHILEHAEAGMMGDILVR